MLIQSKNNSADDALLCAATLDFHATCLCQHFDQRVFYQSQMTCDEASGKKKKSKFNVVV